MDNLMRSSSLIALEAPNALEVLAEVDPKISEPRSPRTTFRWSEELGCLKIIWTDEYFNRVDFLEFYDTLSPLPLFERLESFDRLWRPLLDRYGHRINDVEVVLLWDIPSKVYKCHEDGSCEEL